MSIEKYSLSLSEANPFSDSQARSYSDKRIINEFCPISKFWSLFNDQHEILIGTRGCGKTILLKMMRYSMLNKINDDRAKKLIKEKKYIAFYVPLHLEYITKSYDQNLLEYEKIMWFRFAFNCLLAQSIIIELKEILEDLYIDAITRIKIEYELTESIDTCWQIEPNSPVFQLSKLREKVVSLFYNTGSLCENLSNISNVFKHSLGSPLSSINNIICEKLNISPTWIVCVDEAEFTEECYQKCMNTVFRSDSDRITYKVATLPFYHKTRCTLNDNISVMDGQDFKYTTIDMKYDDLDFINVTNSLVKTRIGDKKNNFEKLDDFIETIGDDNYIDYYSREFGKEKSQREYLEDEIFKQLSERSRNHNIGKPSNEIKKPVIDKLAPIFYLREIYKKSRVGHYIPGWYAGATMIRRVSQGNPRIFIRIMDRLYNAAMGKRLPLSVKTQHKTIIAFAKSFCEETQTLEEFGPEAKNYLEFISEFIHNHTHMLELKQSGISFKLKKNIDLNNHKPWIEKAIAFSRLIIDNESLTTQITADTIYHLVNIYAVLYWLPMRTHSSPITIKIPDNVDCSYTIARPRKKNISSTNEQLSFFPEDINNDY